MKLTNELSIQHKKYLNKIYSQIKNQPADSKIAIANKKIYSSPDPDPDPDPDVISVEGVGIALEGVYWFDLHLLSFELLFPIGPPQSFTFSGSGTGWIVQEFTGLGGGTFEVLTDYVGQEVNFTVDSGGLEYGGCFLTFTAQDGTILGLLVCGGEAWGGGSVSGTGTFTLMP